MTDLSAWVACHAKRPVIRLMLLTVTAQAAYLSYFAYNRYSSQLENVEQIQTTVSMGVQQSNRPLIESTFVSALGNPDLVFIALCSGPSAKISYPPGPIEYCRLNSSNLHRWSLRRPLVGVQDLDLLVVFSPLTAFEPLLVPMVIMVMTLLAVVITISKLQKRFETEVLTPLSQGLNSDAPLDIREMDELRRKNLSHIRLVREKSVSDAMVNMAAQVAHDIRSPLVALDAALKHTEQLPEKQRVTVRHAVNRIRDIANNLLEKNRLQAGTAPVAATAAGVPVAGEPPAVHLLSSLIDPIITEKRLSFESKPGINIDFKLTRESYGLFASIEPVEFRRMLSNLVNNSVEALGDKGAVDVRLTHEDESIILTVSDDGKGIPPEILAKLGRRGETHGKAGGSGLGLFHARSTAESWGGSLEITSAPGQGTAVAIKLPKAAAPAGFVPALMLPPGKPVVVLDDDATIHQVWQGRFDSARVREYGIEIIHFSEPDKLRAWVKASPVKAKSAVCLFDYELLGFKETGLSLAEELGFCGKAILVTSRCEEPRIIEECVRLNIRMIPKGLADFVPITIAAPAPALAVLIDDDAMVHMNWETAAEEAGVELKAFRTPAEFLANLAAFPKDTPIYIDSELEAEIKGEDIAADLKEKGFTNLRLATGHPPERFAHLPWLKVIGKESPWQA